MASDVQVSELLLRWEELREQGKSVSVEELCREAPELAVEVQRRIKVLQDLDPMLATRPTLDARRDATAAPNVQAKPTVNIPGYEILDELGRGGMGVVYKARQVALHRLVALKTILQAAHAGEDDLARFRVEGEAVARLQHPNIVQIYEVGEHAGCPFFSFEYVDGGDLDPLIETSSLTPRQSAELVRTLARAVHYAHQHGIIHRDLKPSNVLLQKHAEPANQEKCEGFAFVPKIADFGLAKRMEKGVTALTRTGSIMGTPCYMAPEQAAGEIQKIGPCTDIYALGAMLYEMLTGQPPFMADTELETLHQVISDEPVRPAWLQPNLARDLETICLKCLEKDPARRYASAQELADDLDRYLNGMTILARPTPWWTKAWRWTLRHANRVALAAISLFALICILVIALLWHEITPQQFTPRFTGPPLKVGVLHSRSGTMASEASSINATILAIEEINHTGGVLGRKIVPVVADGQSDWPTYAREADRLITRDEVCTIFGCWTSASRKSVKEVVEKHNHLLVYPMFSEGLEESPNIVYTGGVSNQQVVPALRWCFEHLKKRRFFLIGSDYIWPHATNAIIRDTVKELGGEVVGEEYFPLGSLELHEYGKKIVAAGPDMILETIAGDSKVAFYRELRHQGIMAERIPVLSFSSGGREQAALGKDLVGHYAAASYFPAIDSQANRDFIFHYQTRFGPDKAGFPIDDPVEASYFSVYLWSQAVQRAGSVDVSAIRAGFKNQQIEAPEGLVRIDDGLHTWKTARVARMLEDHRYHIVYTSPEPIRPIPYPPPRSRVDWDRFLTKLYEGWGERWENPGR